ncbi:MAG: hypothetical protein LBG28_04545 [Tannerella sp.]|nr:hypothetical protein [Tannerella sp.]
MNDFLEQGKKEKHNDGVLFCYNFIADLYLGLWEKEKVEIYLDSAAIYIDKTEDIRYLAPYYRLKAQYIQRYCPHRNPEAISYYQKALAYYEDLEHEGGKNDLVIILRNLTIDGFQRDDSVYIFRNIDKLEDMRKEHSFAMLDFVLMDIKTYLYDFYYFRSHEEAFLDSSIYCAEKALEMYENGLLSQFYKHVAVDLYVMMAELMSRKKNAQLSVVDSLLHIAEIKYDHADSIGSARIYQAKAKILFDRNRIDSAEVIALKAQKRLESGYRNNYYQIAKANIDLIRDIYETKGDYKKVIEYNDLWMNNDEKIRANEVKELELRYELEAKEAEIGRLDSDRMYQENRYRTIVLICILLSLAIVFVILLIRLKKRDLNNQIALVNAEKEEAKLKLKLKEEQAVKMQLEKYEVLSDFHLKEMELIGKSKDLDQLRQDKAALDKQVELYRQKVEAYESMMNRDKETDYDKHNVIIEDVKRLINKQLKNPSKDEYICNIERLNNSYIEVFRKKCNESLSISYLKYCVCFAVGMGIAEVAECFCIESSSVHMIRYRLKKKFGLKNDDDLDLFLQKYSFL